MNDNHPNRRDFLKGIGSIGAFAGLSNVVAARNVPHKSVPKYIDTDGVVEKMEVPQPWYAQLQKTKQVKEKLTSKHADDNSVLSVGITDTPEREKVGKPGLQVRITVDNNSDRGAEIDDLTPSHVNDTPVEVETAERPVPAACKNDDKYDPVPGGVTVKTCSNIDPTTDDSEPDYFGTSGWVLNNHLITARHTFVDGSTDYLVCQGPGSHVADPVEIVGSISKENESEDWIGSESAGIVELEDKIRRPSGVEIPVNGAISETALASYIGIEDYVSKIGTTTGLASGTIEEINIFGQIFSYNGHGVKYSLDIAQGDSGGPIYTRDPWSGDAYIAGMANVAAGTRKSSIFCGGSHDVLPTTQGIAGYRVYEAF